MTGITRSSTLAVPIAACGLAACGGGSGVSSTMPPPADPAITWAQPLSLDSSKELAVMTAPDPDASVAVAVRYDAARQLYYMTLDDAEGGLQITRSTSGAIQTQLADLSTRTMAPDTSVSIFTDASPDAPDHSFTGILRSGSTYAYYIVADPTPAGDVPVTGSASYAIVGHGANIFITGEMNFDFAAGSLGGFFDANDPEDWGNPERGRYDFVDTLFGVGSATFSGGLVNDEDASLGGSFAGLFAGPGAAELIGQYSLTYRSPYNMDILSSATGVFSGVR